MHAIDKQAGSLALHLISYCHLKSLSLGGLVGRIHAAGRLTRETADEVIEYCQEHSLTLGGLVDTLAQFSNDAADLASYANEIKTVAAEYIDERNDELTDVQRYCLLEIVSSLSATNGRIVELFEATGLTY